MSRNRICPWFAFGTSFAALILWFGTTQPGGAQTIRGVVLDHNSEVPIAGAEVVLMGADSKPLSGPVVTSDSGAFSFNTVEGSYYLHVSRIGYKQLTTPRFDLAKGEELPVQITIAVEAVPLAPLTVLSTRRPQLNSTKLEREGYYRRRTDWGPNGLGMGHFLDADDLRTKSATRLSDLLRDLPGVRIEGAGGRAQLITMRSVTNIFQRRCLPALYVDGVLLRPDGDLSIDNIVSPHSVSAIEVYPAINKPAEFGHMLDDPCGAVVIWTGSRQ